MSKARELADVIGTQSTTENVLQGRRNLIINGGFDVWQRGTSLSGLPNMAYTSDRYSQSGGQYNLLTHSRQDCSLDGFKYAHRITSTYSGTNSMSLHQRIENTGQFYNGQELTFSFWARASKATNLRGMRLYDNSNYVTGYDVCNVTTSWQKFIVTKTVNNLDAAAPYIRCSITHDGANMDNGDWVETTGWQLEVGSVATPFEHRSYGEELALCQRYYEIIESQGYAYAAQTTNGYPRSAGAWTVSKRAQPSVTSNSGNWVWYPTATGYSGYHNATENAEYPTMYADAEL